MLCVVGALDSCVVRHNHAGWACCWMICIHLICNAVGCCYHFNCYPSMLLDGYLLIKHTNWYVIHHQIDCYVLFRCQIQFGLHRIVCHPRNAVVKCVSTHQMQIGVLFVCLLYDCTSRMHSSCVFLNGLHCKSHNSI